jgi:hypothetical protein
METTDKLLEIRRTLLNGVDKRDNTKEDLIKVMEEVANELLKLNWNLKSIEEGA